MERGNALIKFAIGLVFFAMLIYGGYTLLTLDSDELKTVTAISMEVRESVTVTGWCVRNETVVVSPGGGATLRVSEGEKVAAGAPLAISYNSGSDLSRAEEIRQLTLELEQLCAIAAGQDDTVSAADSVYRLADALSRGDLTELDAIALDVNAYVLGKGTISPADAAARIQQVEDRITNLRISSGGNAAVYSPVAGTFSALVDGYEGITTADVTGGKLLPSQVESLFEKADAVPAGAFGKLITGYRWYFVAVMPYADATRLIGRSTIPVVFSRTYAASLTMTVVSVGADENGQAAVVLSCDRNISEVSDVREMTAELVFSSVSGIRIPREAVHLVEEVTVVDRNGTSVTVSPQEARDMEGDKTVETHTVVYLLWGYQARQAAVTIVEEQEDWYLVSPTLYVRDGAEIIVRAADLADRAVVKEGSL